MGSDRNAPCWCGSGKKYKKCHLNRESQEQASPWETQANFRRIFETKGCLHPDANKATCRGGIIRAHTVRRSADLKAIAKDGHVYQATADFKSLNKTGGRVAYQLVGINHASTFWGFCGEHDSSTFAPLETESFGPTRQQAFLLTYRPLAKELYLKRCALESTGLFRDIDRGRSKTEQMIIQDIRSQMAQATNSVIRTLEHYKALFDADLRAGDFGRIRYIAIHLDHAPDVMCSGVTQPESSFNGFPIQDFADPGTALENVAFSLLATDTGGAAVFAWPVECDAASSALVDSLLAMPDADIPAALVRFALSEFENSFLRPSWWESLDDATRRSLEDRFNHNVNIFEGFDSDRLRDDGVRPVDWRVTKVEQVRA